MTTALAMEHGGARGPSRRLGRLAPWLRRCPRAAVDALFASAAVADALLRTGRHATARAWAGRRGLRGLARERLALALLANHGRFVVDELLLPLMPHAEIARRMPLDGRQHLDRLDGSGAVMLVFHLGPPGAWRALCAHGYRVHTAVRTATALQRPGLFAGDGLGSTVGLDDGDATVRVGAMVRMRRLIAAGALVVLAADGPFGHEAFRIDVQGAPLLVRRGWFALRRAAWVPVLPVFVHREADGRSRVEVHAPLPAPVEGEADDLAACRDALTPIVHAFVARYPAQCRWLAMPHWSTTPPPAGPDREAP